MFCFLLTEKVNILSVNKEKFSQLKMVLRSWKKVNKYYLIFEISRFQIREYPIDWWDTYDINVLWDKNSQNLFDSSLFFWSKRQKITGTQTNRTLIDHFTYSWFIIGLPSDADITPAFVHQLTPDFKLPNILVCTDNCNQIHS